MFKFKFDDGFSRSYCVECSNDFVRIGSRMAYYMQRKEDRRTVWVFWSYATPIAIVSKIEEEPPTKWLLTLNVQNYRCSMSTIHQFSKFLAIIDAPFDYHDVKERVTDFWRENANCGLLSRYETYKSHMQLWSNQELRDYIASQDYPVPYVHVV